MRMRSGGPPGVARPYQPSMTSDETERHGEALDHIARALSAIDHNIDVLTTAVQKLARAIARQ